MPSRTPCAWATGTSSPIASAIIRRARPMSRLPGTRPPETRTSVPVPSAAASAIAALLSADRRRPRAGVGVGEEPAPAQAGDAQPGRPHGRGGGRPGRLRRRARATARSRAMSCRTHRSTPRRHAQPLDRRLVERQPAESRSRALLQERGHPADRQVRIGQRPGRRRQLEDLDQVAGGRLRSRPSSMEKRGWKPFSQARKATPVL